MSTIDPRTKAAQRRAQGFAVSGWSLLAAYVVLWLIVGASIAIVMQPFTLIGTKAAPADAYGITAAIASFVIILLGAAGCWVGYLLTKPLRYARINDVLRRFLPTAIAFAAGGPWTAPVLGAIDPAAHLPEQPPVLRTGAVLATDSACHHRCSRAADSVAE